MTAPLPPMARLTDAFAAAAQPDAESLAQLAAAGFRTLICNRPDDEVPPGERAADMQAAAQAAGMAFAQVAVPHGPITPDLLEAEIAALRDLPGPHFAYCAAGIRAALIWAFASAGRIPTDDIMDALANAGLAMPGLRSQIDMLAAAR
ncbi:MAG: TIGR01244 family phosphatase [Rhodobacteraceae bacterium]|nr:TIGR01244 family phosphatase [Paracoccaceae bacterium]